MRKDETLLRCRTCGQRFRATRTEDRGWLTEFPRKPPSPAWRSHRGSPLCRWEVHRLRRRLWRNIRPFFEDEPAAYVTLVPPGRTVAFDALPRVSIADEARSLRRLLDQRLPKGTVAVGVFDVGMADDQTNGRRERYWVPHFHVLVAGVTVAEAEELLDGLYAATEEVEWPVHVRDAPTPRGALTYSLKHVGDVRARAIYVRKGNAAGEGKRKRQLKADERVVLERWARRQRLDGYLLLKGLRRFGGTVKRT